MGEMSTQPILELGEMILYMPAKGHSKQEEKCEPRFHLGVFVGMVNSSLEAVVVTYHALSVSCGGSSASGAQSGPTTIRSHFGSSYGLTRECRLFVMLLVSQNGR